MKNIIISILISLLLISMVPINSACAAPKIEPASIRVELHQYINDTNRISITIEKGSYSMGGNPFIVLLPGHQYAISLEDGTLRLYADTDLLGDFGTYLELVPKAYSEDNIIALNGIPYMGSMAFRADGEYIRPVNKLMLEDYLKGVVPREMPASWPKAALEAQTVAARTYALKCIKGAGSSYDVVDTTSNQVYGGYQRNLSTDKAVDETAGQVLEYKGQLILAEYSASNGQIVEEANYSLGNGVSYRIETKADPYDVKNPWDSQPEKPWSVVYKKVQIEPSQLDLANNYLANSNLAALDGWWENIESQLYASAKTDNTKPHSYAEKIMIDGVKSMLASYYPNKDVHITEIVNMDMDLNNRTPGNRLKTDNKVSMDVKFIAKDLQTGQYDMEKNAQLSSGDTSSDKPRLKVYEQRLDFDVRTMRAIFGAEIIKSYLIDSFGLTESGDAYAIIGQGSGHGKGLSQWGANKRAEAGQDYKEILAFYYPGAQLVSYSIPEQKPISITDVSNISEPYNANAGPLLISYQLNQDSRVTVKIWDKEYRSIAVVADNVAQKAGTNTISWDGKTMQPGDYYYTIEAIDQWGYQANCKGTFALIKKDMPSRGSDEPRPPAEEAPPQKTGTVAVSTSLNVRSGPGTQYSRIGSLRNGDSVTVLGEENGWYRIQYGSGEGYVSSQYVEMNASPPAEEAPPQKTGTVTVSTSLNVRSGPGTQYSRIGSLRNGDSVTVLGEENGWYRIQYGSGEGYVSSQYVEMNASPPAEEAPPQKTGTVAVSTSLNVRSGPGTQYSRIGSLRNGDSVTVLGEENGWYRIQYGSGEGYVSSQYVNI